MFAEFLTRNLTQTKSAKTGVLEVFVAIALSLHDCNAGFLSLFLL